MAALLDDLQVVPTTSGDKTQRYCVPSHWKPQTDCVQTFALLPTSEEWKRCKDLIAETLNSASIKKVTRVQNLWLWEAYTFNRKRMCERSSGQVNERLLFHGSGAINPYDIACSEDGFDVRHSKQGSWGRAIYFAEKAQYSNYYAHCTSSKRELILAIALIGDSYDFGTKKKQDLLFPPVKLAQSQNLCNIKYDSVSAISRDTRVYILYENLKHIHST